MDHRRDQQSLSLDLDSDGARLRELGYKQELKRQLSAVSNFAFSFSMISVLAGVTITFNTGLRYGGPFSATIGWIVVSVFNGFIALSMAEICSAYPTSGGLYYWSAKLSGKEWAPFAAWTTGWFNLVGQWAGFASGEFAFAQLLQVIVLLSTGGANRGGYVASKYLILCFHGGLLLIHGSINSLPISWLSVFSQLGAIWNVIGTFVLMVLIPLVATKRASIEFVFTHFNTENDAGIHSKIYIFALGLLMSQYSMGGYDASAHLTEETKKADKSPAMGIISAVVISGVVGWAYLIGITFAVTNIPYLLSSENDAAGYAIAEVFYLAFKNRYGSGVGGIICLGIVAVALFFSGISALTSNSRNVTGWYMHSLEMEHCHCRQCGTE